MQQIVRTIALAYNNLPRPHRIMLGSLTVVTLAVAVWRPYSYHSEHLPIVKNVTLDGEALRYQVPEDSEPFEASTPYEDIPVDELDQKVEGEAGVNEYIISSGDTLGSVLTQYGIEMADVSLLAKQNPALRNLNIGQQISWSVTAEGDLQRLTWVMSRRETRIYERTDNGFKETKETLQGEWRNQMLNGTLNGSFVSSAKAAGLSGAEINAVTKALQWQLDFKKLRKGDRFSVLLSREMLNGRSEQSQLLAVRMNSSGKDYYAFRAEDGKFYDRAASGLARGFLRNPTLKSFRITSPFSPRRLNPVTGRIAPHKGVDFAMPVGTPVLSVGDGEVVLVKHTSDAGLHVVIRHGRQYSTRYMHLKKALVQQGQKVKRGDRIALSGNTGRSTGPHLHYEFWVNQQAVNPMTVKLPRSEGLTGKERDEYLALVKQLTPQLQLD